MARGEMGIDVLPMGVLVSGPGGDCQIPFGCIACIVLGDKTLEITAASKGKAVLSALKGNIEITNGGAKHMIIEGNSLTVENE